MSRGAQDLTPVTPVVVRLDERGRLLGSDERTPVPRRRIADHLARHLPVPPRATDIYVYVHGWQTSARTAVGHARKLVQSARVLAQARPSLYPGLDGGYRPWVVVVCWPSSSAPSLAGYRRIRDRAHAMSAPETGQAPLVLGHLLGYLERHRSSPDGPPVMANSRGQYLHVLGHSFGGRFLCEAMQWAAGHPELPSVLGWTRVPGDPGRPFTVDSALIFQMAAPRDAFSHLFPELFPRSGRPGAAPLGGPLVLTYSRWDTATGFWHLRAESAPGIGHSGTAVAPTPQFTTRLLATDAPYSPAQLDHRIVNVDAAWRYRGPRVRHLSPGGAHSDFLHAESSHLLLSLSALSR
ncbi:alpha/beta hydrolase [Streptomyces sp. H28]|uniref:alpha/beta hydrolase n=1 Tax=Streptomyces sp. H28 TaxID=2775865 RepID=UPI001786158E|nr:alpha/beta hydrolase [Streptomyces sp. H28]MBD9733597.1 alpha/beta hydrolase [Streptomyces sp. H28]